MDTAENYLKAAIESLNQERAGQSPATVADNWYQVAMQGLKLALADAERERNQVAAAVEYVVGLPPLPAARPTQQQARELVSAVAQRSGSTQGIGAQIRLGHVPTFEHDVWCRIAVGAVEQALLSPTVLFYPLATAPLDGTTVLLEVGPDQVAAGYWEPDFGLANLGEDFGFSQVGAWMDGSMASISYQEYNSFAHPRRWAPMPGVRPDAVPLVTGSPRWPARTGWLSREALPEEMDDEVLLRAYVPGTGAYAEERAAVAVQEVSVAVFRGQPEVYSHWLPSAD